MNIYVIESMMEISRIESEINSEFLYESILIESDVKKSPLQKIKEIWDKFVSTMKRIIDSIRVFIKTNIQNIKYGSKEVEIKDRSNEISEVKKLISDINNYMDNIEEFDSDYKEKIKRDMYKVDSKKMKKSDGVRFYEKQLKESQDLLNQADKVITKFVDKYNGTRHEFKKSIKIHSVNAAINIIRNNINNLINDINRDIKTLIA